MIFASLAASGPAVAAAGAATRAGAWLIGAGPTGRATGAEPGAVAGFATVTGRATGADTARGAGAGRATGAEAVSARCDEDTSAVTVLSRAGIRGSSRGAGAALVGSRPSARSTSRC